eukprot:TRINITY_DN7532_c0_g1_i1.p1 TRINITY_DN7532_c0_g1~~TRINITY_DN7532_c0_g1_i1.p1  ORF type:complete len:123 (-),score=9.32 TRINITY_DN7532_c0_g1_i1:189-557(-)
MQAAKSPEKEYLSRESKLTVPEELLNQLPTEPHKSPYSKEEQKLNPPFTCISVHSAQPKPVDKPSDKKNVAQQAPLLKEGGKNNNSLHGVIARQIKAKREKVNFSFIYRRLITVCTCAISCC